MGDDEQGTSSSCSTQPQSVATLKPREVHMKRRMANLAKQKLISTVIHIGNELCLFGIFGRTDIKERLTPSVVAHYTKCKEVHIKAFLETIMCAEIVEHFPVDNGKVIEYHSRCFNDKINYKYLEQHSYMHKATADMEALIKRLPLNYDEQDDQDERRKRAVAKLAREKLLFNTDILDIVNRNKELNLKKGDFKVLNIGCSDDGEALFEYGEFYPSTTFYGIDTDHGNLSKPQKEVSNRREDRKNFSPDNVLFYNVKNYGLMRDEWSEMFNLVLMEGLYSKIVKLDEALQEIKRVLTPCGTLLIVELDGTKSFYEQYKNRNATLLKQNAISFLNGGSCFGEESLSNFGFGELEQILRKNGMFGFQGGHLENRRVYVWRKGGMGGDKKMIKSQETPILDKQEVVPRAKQELVAIPENGTCNLEETPILQKGLTFKTVKDNEIQFFPLPEPKDVFKAKFSKINFASKRSESGESSKSTGCEETEFVRFETFATRKQASETSTSGTSSTFGSSLEFQSDN